MRRTKIQALAQGIDRAAADEHVRRMAPVLGAGSDALAVATLLATAYPALAHPLEADAEIARSIAAEGHHAARDRAGLLARLRASAAAATADGETVARALRRFAR